MNIKIGMLFIAFSLFIGSFSCSNKSNHSRKPAVSIQVESVHQKIIFGDDLQISISVKIKDGDIRDTKIFFDTTMLTSSKETEFIYSLKKFKQLGKQTIRVVLTKTDGVEYIYFKTFEVFSDLVPEAMTYEIVETLPHNPEFFTQGLEFHNGFLYEGTGQNGESGLYKLNHRNAKILQSIKLQDKYFGEGITIINDKIFQLTYKTKIAFVYELQSMALVDSFKFESSEGWGLTNDDKHLIMSDGSNILTYIDPVSLKPVKKLQVYSDKNPVVYLNELEYSDGFIYANIWGTNYIYKIDALTGKAVQKIDMEGLLLMNPDQNKQIDVLNGIAIDPLTKKMYVTGKYYPKLFEIRFIKKG